MNDNFTNTDTLIQYLDGELQGDAVDSLQQKIKTDPSVAAELESLRLTRELVKTYGLKKTIGSVHAEMMKERKEVLANRSIGFRQMVQYSTRIAAVLLVVLGSIILYQYFSATTEGLYRDNYSSFQLRETRSASGISPLQEAYTSGDDASVIKKFTAIKNPQAADYFLHGNASLHINNATAAISSFLALQEKNKLDNTHFFEEDTEYYLALAYLHNNEPAKALVIFNKIHADDGHAYHQKVSSWFLRRLERLAHK